MNQRNLFLFLLCSIIWGTTWLVIKFQIDSVTPIVGVFFRFLLATILMMGINLIFIRKNFVFPLRNHFFFILHGLFNFCLNYILTYISEKYVSSGMVAVTFTLLIYFNMVLLHLIFKIRISKNVFTGALLGLVGIICLFYGEVVNTEASGRGLLGIIIGIVATFCASLGNMVAFYNHRQKIPVMTFNAYGMFYGTILSFIIGLLMGETFTLPHSFSFTSSLLYLSFFGTVIAFWAYQTLVGEMGADRAAYTSILSPMIAVIVSVLFESLAITPLFILGILFCLSGNFVALRKERVL